jgi:hypothetical protein
MGLAALHWAAYSGRTESLDLLLKAGADVESRTDDGRTAFHAAAHRGHLRFIIEFLKAKPDLEGHASNGWTALHVAVVANQRRMAGKLIELGVREDGPDAHVDTLADLAEQYRRDWFAELGRLGIKLSQSVSLQKVVMIEPVFETYQITCQPRIEEPNRDSFRDTRAPLQQPDAPRMILSQRCVFCFSH